MSKFQLVTDLRVANGMENTQISSMEKFMEDLKEEDRAKLEQSDRDLEKVLSILEEQFDSR